MRQIRWREGFTKIELIVILVFLAIVLGILIPAVQYAREKSRRESCFNNLKQMGLGIHNYYDARKILPPSADLRGEEKVKTAGGWSCLFKILPNMEYNDLFYGNLVPSDLKSKTIDPLNDMGTNNSIAMAREISFTEFICPSCPHWNCENPSAPLNPPGQKHAITNYKALGATSIESLKVGLDPDSPPPYGDASMHPDGVLFPAAQGLKFDDIKDGLSTTILLVETIDFKASTWIAGCDVTLVGMNKADSYRKFPDESGSWAPSDFNGKFYGEATPALQKMKAFTAFDFGPGKQDAGKYPAGVGRTPDYGPSSGHPGVVNHLFCDGSARSIREDIDYAAYFFAITRNGGDKGSNQQQ